MNPPSRRLVLATWASLLLFLAAWWGFSYRYGIGFAATGPALNQKTTIRISPTESGIALVSGVGKVVVYVSWASLFTRHGFIFEPVLAHEFPHPWLGYQNESGRLWFSFPIGALFGIALAAAFLTLYPRRRKSDGPTS